MTAKNLADFLLTANPDHALALAEAHAYTVNDGHMLPATTISGILAKHNLTGHVVDISNDVGHPFRHKMLSMRMSIEGDHPFNFIIGKTVGDEQIATLNQMITGIPELAVQLTAFRDTVLFLANKTVQPLLGTTLHDVLITRNVCPMRPVTQAGGYAVLTTVADCPTHNPRILMLNPRTGTYQRIANFMGVGAAGVYDVQLPSVAWSASLVVDAPYPEIFPVIEAE
jgi:hypothetical protein